MGLYSRVEDRHQHRRNPGGFPPVPRPREGLRYRGHDIIMAVNPAFVDFAAAAGLRAVSCGPPFGPDEVLRPPEFPEGATQPWAEFKKWESLFRDVPGRYRDLSAACAGADLVVAHSFHYAALLVHDRLRIPWVCVALGPGQFVNRLRQPVAQPAPRADLNLLASSRTFSSPDPGIHDGIAVTGFWYEDGRDQCGWQPTPALRAFVEGGDRPLVLCLGGAPGPDAAEVVRVHAQAAGLLGKTLVVQAGWARLHDIAQQEAAGRDHVLVTDFVSHEWLFARGRRRPSRRHRRHGPLPQARLPDAARAMRARTSTSTPRWCGSSASATRWTRASSAPRAWPGCLPKRSRHLTRVAMPRNGLALAEDGIGTACGLIEDCSGRHGPILRRTPDQGRGLDHAWRNRLTRKLPFDQLTGDSQPVLSLEPGTELQGVPPDVRRQHLFVQHPRQTRHGELVGMHRGPYAKPQHTPAIEELVVAIRFHQHRAARAHCLSRCAHTTVVDDRRGAGEEP